MKMSIEHSWNNADRVKQNIGYWWNGTDKGKQNIENGGMVLTGGNRI
jgi:hypothetical protein